MFVRFYMDFTKISKTHVLFKLQFFTKIPGNTWGLTNIPLICGLALRKKSPFAIGPLGTGRRRSGRIPANRRPGPAGREWGTVHGCPGLYSLAQTGRKEGRWWPTAAHPSGSRGGLPSGEGRHKTGRWVAAWASTDPRRGAWGVGRPWGQEEAELDEWWQWRPAAEQGELVGVLAREEGKGEAL
jgi:hypothetical protein